MSANMLPLRAITVKQPWAWCIVYGGKLVENRGRRDPWHTAVGERIAIHAGKSRDEDGCFDQNVRTAWRAADAADKDVVEVEGAIIGTAILRDLHHADDCECGCSDWAQPGQWHLVLRDVKVLTEPIRARGALGLWTIAAS